MPFPVPAAALAALESDVQEALARGASSGLDVLGYGEVTLVLRLRTADASYACKRLPCFRTEKHFAAYQRLLAEYIDRLEASGIRVAETQTWHSEQLNGGVIAYCVQRELPAAGLGSRLLAVAAADRQRDFFDRFLDAVHGAAGPTLGLDAQASNWIDDDGLTYLDVTTPLLRDGRGRERLDVRLFFTSLPWAVRDAVRMATSRSIFDKFYQPRGVILDFLGNLYKERLDGLIPWMLPMANQRLSEPISADEVAAYYRSDARMWELVQRMRRWDQRWQQRVRRRPYPFLLPPAIAR